MCGIAGWFGPSPDVGESERRIARMTDSIRHRGPDDVGWWHDEHAALGMTRLAIIDLAGGNQPRFAGPWCVVFNGEIYNYREVRRQLLSEGREVDGDGDAEVVARAVEHWGDAAFARLDGMFAIAAFHREERRALLARDRFGEKPLYVWRRGETTAFASEPRALRAIGPPPPIDQGALTRYLALGFVPGPTTIWQDVETLSPGHHMEIAGSSRTVSRTVSRTTNSEAPERGTDPVDDLDLRLRTAVTSRLVADVEVGVLLSGGIDSSLIAAHAAAVHPGVHSFSVRIDDPNRDESRYSSLVADRLHTTHHTVTVGDRDALDVVDELPTVYDEPFADSSAIPTLILSRFVASHVKVALSGDGGDELFSGYTRHRLRPSGQPRSAALGALSEFATHTWWIRPQGPWRSLQDRTAPMSSRYLDLVGGTDRWWLRRLGRDPADLAPLDQAVERHLDSGDRWPEAADRGLYLPGDILTKIDRASMSCGLEVRAPFLAPVVADWAASLPTSIIGPAGSKQLPRSLLRRYFGPELADRPKRGFSVPVASWLRGSLSHLVDVACDGHLTSTGLVNRREVLRLRSALGHRFDKAATPLWTIAMFELWFQRWSDL